MSSTSPELSTSPPSSYLVNLLVLGFPTSYGLSLSIVSMVHFRTFCDGPGWSTGGSSFPSRFILWIISITSSSWTSCSCEVGGNYFSWVSSWRGVFPSKGNSIVWSKIGIPPSRCGILIINFIICLYMGKFLQTIKLSFNRLFIFIYFKKNDISRNSKLHVYLNTKKICLGGVWITQ